MIRSWRDSRWRDRLHDWRDCLLASPRFHRLAARFPLTRPIARRRSSELFDLCAGFIYSQVVLASVRSGLLDLLNEGAQPRERLLNRLGLPEMAGQRLLEAAEALRLAESRSAGQYGLGDLGAVLVAAPGIRAMVDHHALLYEDLQDPLELLQGERGETALGRYWAYAGNQSPDALTGSEVDGYSGLMAASQPMVATEVLDAYSLRRHRRLMDVGGGEGAFLIAAARRWPHLHGQVIDLPAVAERARARIAEAGLEERLTAAGADFFRDALPADADVVSLVRILHDHDDEEAARLLKNLHRSLRPGTTVLVAEPMSGTPGAERVGGAYFGIYLFAMGRGRPRTVAENRGLLEGAGFEQIRLLPGCNPLQARVIAAKSRSLSR
ncbi:methyltransferase [Halorhodospira halophila]|uniref:methyltransferase n=1 Tax=Halorhodospira halophila TaxID=1053 RepID=UPI0019129B41|nr:methyltransferase [Halorhodospira halophila]